MREALNRLLDWFRRDRLDAELVEELRFHREQLERDARQVGASPDAATHAAHARLGNATITREAARERWSWPWLDHLQQDVRHALRGLRRSPAFTASVILTLALGIGANAAMFGLLDRLMLRPYRFLREPDRVHRVYTQSNNRGTVSTSTNFEYTTYLDLQRWSSSMSDYAAFFDGINSAIGVGDASRERPIAAVSATFFGFFDAPPVLGRYFGAAEDRTPRGEAVTVLDHDYWMTEYAGRNVLGETVHAGNVVYTIIGVAPRGFNGVSEDRPPVLYIPITTFAGSRPGNDATAYFTKYNWSWMEMMVRRKPGVSMETAQRDLTGAFIRSWNAARTIDPEVPSVEVSKPVAIPGSLKVAAGPDPDLEARTMRWVTGVAVIVLLIACANVANLFVGRALRRRREVALRLALGVGRGRLAAQALTESLVLALLGCGAGVLVAQWGGSLLRRALVGPDAKFDLLRDGRTLLVALGAALLAALITGLAPLAFAGRADLAASLKAGAREGTYQRSPVRSTLLILQAALSVVLLVGAGLFVRSLGNVTRDRLGYDVDRIMLVARNLRGADMSDSDQVRMGRELLQAAKSIPQVEAAAWVGSVPFWSTSTTDFFVPGIDSVRRLGRFTYQTASTDYFRASGTRILRGRGFTDADRANAPPIVVVSESMARVIWPGEDAIGKCIRMEADTMPCTNVVGIAEDAVQMTGDMRPRSTIQPEGRLRYYLPIEQFRPSSGFALMLRMRGDVRAAREPVRKVLQAVMPGQTYVTVRAMQDLIATTRRSWRLGATVFASFGILAVVVAAVGMYGVIAYNVAQRMHELGVRMALGARAGDVVRLVVGQGVTFAVVGVVLGGALAFAAGHWVEPLLYQQSARDPMVFGVVGLVLVGVALLASSIPAASATRADPQRVLRSE